MIAVLKKLRYSAVALLLLVAPSCSEKIDPDIEPEPEPDPEEYAAVQLVNPAPMNSEFQKVAYFPYYRDCSTSVIPDETLRMLDVACYAFATIKPDFTVNLEEPAMLQVLVNRCHRLGLKVLLSFNGTSSLYTEMSIRKSTRDIFIKSVMSIVDKYGLDGVDNDWEWPSAANSSAVGNLYLMREFSNRLHQEGSDKLLTMAISPGKYEGNYTNGIKDELFECVDWFNVMVYDDFSTTMSGIHHSPYSMMETAYNYWVVKRKLPPTKFVGGLPCYGRASGLPQSGTANSYAGILYQGGDPDSDQAVVSSSSYSNYTIYYNGRPTIRKKVSFCLEHEVGGYFFWEAGQDVYDDRSLIKAAYKVVFPSED